jgi:PIN domain nuclease of toxin-antitoxin system
MGDLLLDTCAMLWLAQGAELAGDARKAIADRIIIATAREARLVLMTRDKAILAYSRAGYVQTMVC